MNSCDIRIGTCGFSYRDWRGIFYPEDLKQADFLPWYAGRFRFVEIDYTYYRLPEAGSSQRLCRKAPEGFLFSVKATGSLTHQRDEGWAGEAQLFARGIQPYAEAGKLGAVLAQFPYSFHYTPQNRTYLARFCDAMAAFPLCLEFRNTEWQQDRVYEDLARRGVNIVQPDLPDLKGLPKADDRVTGRVAYVRFHGRNSRTWWRGDNVSRYDYLYGKEELLPWVERILDMALRTDRLFVAFNNHHKGQAVQNAFELQKMLEGFDGPLDG